MIPSSIYDHKPHPLTLLIIHTGGYFSSNKSTAILRQTILELCTELKADAVSLVDAVAPPDFILHSPIGRSDGQVRLTMLSMTLHYINLSMFHNCLLALEIFSTQLRLVLANWTLGYLMLSIVT